MPLGEARQPGGKVVQAWAIEGDCGSRAHPQQHLRDGMAARVPDAIGPFRKSTERLRFAVTDARRKILMGQAIFVDRLLDALGSWHLSRRRSARGVQIAKSLFGTELSAHGTICAAGCTTRKADGIRRSELRRSWTTSANYVGLTVQPAELIQSIRPVVMYTIAPRCAPKT